MIESIFYYGVFMIALFSSLTLVVNLADAIVQQKGNLAGIVLVVSMLWTVFLFLNQ